MEADSRRCSGKDRPGEGVTAPLLAQTCEPQDHQGGRKREGLEANADAEMIPPAGHLSLCGAMISEHV